MRALAMSVAMAAMLAGGCAELESNDGPTLTQNTTATGAQFLLDRWRYDAAEAFLCLRDPGEAFTGTQQVPQAAGCVPLHVTVQDNRLNARFDMSDVPANLLPDFAASSSPWFLAVAGTRGTASETLVMGLVTSPIPSDAGPS